MTTLTWYSLCFTSIMEYSAKHVDYLLDVIPGLELFQQQHCLLGLLVSLNFVFNHQWDLRDFLNAVS